MIEGLDFVYDEEKNLDVATLIEKDMPPWYETAKGFYKEVKKIDENVTMGVCCAASHRILSNRDNVSTVQIFIGPIEDYVKFAKVLEEFFEGYKISFVKRIRIMLEKDFTNNFQIIFCDPLEAIRIFDISIHQTGIVFGDETSASVYATKEAVNDIKNNCMHYPSFYAMNPDEVVSAVVDAFPRLNMLPKEHILERVEEGKKRVAFYKKTDIKTWISPIVNKDLYFYFICPTVFLLGSNKAENCMERVKSHFAKNNIEYLGKLVKEELLNDDYTHAKYLVNKIIKDEFVSNEGDVIELPGLNMFLLKHVCEYCYKKLYEKRNEKEDDILKRLLGKVAEAAILKKIVVNPKTVSVEYEKASAKLIEYSQQLHLWIVEENIDKSKIAKLITPLLDKVCLGLIVKKGEQFINTKLKNGLEVKVELILYAKLALEDFNGFDVLEFLEKIINKDLFLKQ